MIIADALHARQTGDVAESTACERMLAGRSDAGDESDTHGGPGVRDRLLARRVANRALLDRLSHTIGVAWDFGWQPADLIRITDRQLTGRHATMMCDVIAARMRSYAPATVDSRWAKQLHSHNVTVWWTGDDTYCDEWSTREQVGRANAITHAIDLIELVNTLPRQPILCPLPGTATSRHVMPDFVGDVRMLDRVRALLAKAESTEFPEEAEALTAKAQEIMARHSIDTALLAAARAVRDEPSGRRIGIDAPYEAAKMLLLQKVSEANRCRAVWAQPLGFATVIGFEADLQAVELLFLSLLVQATTAVVRAGSRQTSTGRSRTRSFRQSFLSAFAVRIGERLCGGVANATRAATREASVSADSLLPVLAARDEAVRAKISDCFPGLVHRSIGLTDQEGWASGTAAADQAVIHAGAGYLGSGPV